MPVLNDFTRHFSFGPDCRLKKRNEFAVVQSRGNKLYSKHFIVTVLPTNRCQSRLGITITKKVDQRSVARNLLRRRLREVFRLHRHQLVSTFDITIIARNNAVSCSFSEIKREVMGSLYHGKYLNRAGNKA